MYSSRRRLRVFDPEYIVPKNVHLYERAKQKNRKIPEKSGESAEEVQKKFRENQFLKKSIICSNGKVNDYFMMRQYSCGILPTFLSSEAQQGKIISYATAI